MKIGFAFSDHVRTEKIKRRTYATGESYSMRRYIMYAVLAIFCSILLAKLTSLQLIHGSYYRALSDSNRIRTKIVHAPRGIIFDRNKIPLVYNIPGFRQVKRDKTIFVSRDKALQLIAQGDDTLEVDNLRQYPFKDTTAHALGYVGQISKESLSMPAYKDYAVSEIVGKTGIERFYENKLRGIDGKQLVEVDVSGKEVRILGQTDPISGQDITLTLDAKLQGAAFQAMKDVRQGVAIISSPKGEIISLISKPSFDPNLFTLDATYQASSSGYQQVSDVITDNDNKPLLNRAISGLYPPGSTFKIVTAAAGLERRIIDKNFEVKDTGILHVGAFSFANWFYLENGKTDGDVNVVKAISRSNDIYFYKLAEMVSVGHLSDTARQFGVGRLLGVDLTGEEKGILPSEGWKKKHIGEPWYLGDTYHFGIGQGYLLTTPLQVNAWTQVIANGGTLYRPHLLQSKDQTVLTENLLRPENISLIREGMINACERGGVAWPLFDFTVQNEKLQIDGKNIFTSSQATTSANLKAARHIRIACKTGTAQYGGEETEPHAWITLFAPAYNPEIVVTVLVESGGQGSSVAAPIAKEILTVYFTQK